jgi:hypothetical protein
MDLHEVNLRERAIFDGIVRILESFTPDQRTLIGATRKWSAKDLLGHLVWWETNTAEQLGSIRQGAWQPRYIPRKEFHALNQAQVAAASNQSFASLLEEFRSRRAEVRGLYLSLADDSEACESALKLVHAHCLRHCGHHFNKLTEWQARVKQGQVNAL